MVVWLQVQQQPATRKRGMLARHRWTGMDEPNSTSRDDWAAALRRAHFLFFFSGAKGLEDAHGRGASQLDRPTVRELAPSGSQGAKGVLAAVADVQEAVLILVLQVLRYGTERAAWARRGAAWRVRPLATTGSKAAEHTTLLTSALAGGSVFPTNTKIACSEGTEIRLRSTYTSWPIVMSCGIRYLHLWMRQRVSVDSLRIASGRRG